MKKRQRKKDQKETIKNTQNIGKKATIAEEKWQQEWQRKVEFVELEEKIKGEP